MDEGHEYPYRFERTSEVASLRERFGELADGTESGEVVSVAGRVMSVRGQGKVAFADLVDTSGRIQLFARLDDLGERGMAEFERIGVGDIVGASGEVMKTRRGELSIKLKETMLLAPCLRPMPDVWHGMTNVEARYRQRYLDLLLNPAARRALEARAVINRAIRHFMEARGFIEVETPLLQPVASGAVARPFVTHHNALGIDLYLRVAPELYLKRLLVGGMDRVFELNRSFRNEGLSTQHNTEFTMLEAYEAFVDYNHTIDLVEDLVRGLALKVTGSTTVVVDETEVDFARRFARQTMFEVIRDVYGRDLEGIWRSEDWEALGAEAHTAGVKVEPRWPPGKVLAEIFEATTERRLIEPTFVMGFPKDISPLAKDHRRIPGFTEHADLVIGGIEIAPIYSELNDPAEQRRRFEQQALARATGDDEAMLADEDFLDALAHGMPPAGGFGLGVDRLLVVLLGLHSLREVILFPTLRPEGGSGGSSETRRAIPPGP